MNPGNLIVRGVTYNSRDTSSIHNTASYRPKSRLLNCEQVLHVLYTGNPNEFSHQRAYTPHYAEFFKKRKGGGVSCRLITIPTPKWGGVLGWDRGGVEALSDSHTWTLKWGAEFLGGGSQALSDNHHNTLVRPSSSVGWGGGSGSLR